MKYITHIVDGSPEIKELVIDDHDIWSLDYTLAPVFSKALRKLRDEGQGAHYVDNADVPFELRTDINTCFGNDDDTSFDLLQKRWHYVLGEMIFAADYLTNNLEGEMYDMGVAGTCKDHYKWLLATEKRVQNGFELIGRYFGKLWS